METVVNMCRAGKNKQKKKTHTHNTDKAVQPSALHQNPHQSLICSPVFLDSAQSRKQGNLTEVFEWLTCFEGNPFFFKAMGSEKEGVSFETRQALKKGGVAFETRQPIEDFSEGLPAFCTVPNRGPLGYRRVDR